MRAWLSNLLRPRLYSMNLRLLESRIRRSSLEDRALLLAHASFVIEPQRSEPVLRSLLAKAVLESATTSAEEAATLYDEVDEGLRWDLQQVKELGQRRRDESDAPAIQEMHRNREAEEQGTRLILVALARLANPSLASKLVGWKPKGRSAAWLWQDKLGMQPHGAHIRPRAFLTTWVWIGNPGRDPLPFKSRSLPTVKDRSD